MVENQYPSWALNDLEEGDRLLADGNLKEASGKYWAAASASVKRMAARKGWARGNTHDLLVAIAQLIEQTNQPDFRELFYQAESLHSYSYGTTKPGEPPANEERVRRYGQSCW
ncbi:MAG: Archaeal PaREP1/PaREP8 family, partial [Dehalococcoidia bacterium]|nr:Archaeal PaREP1/PaREP8 family [Dehalococcoidia bacterium]